MTTPARRWPGFPLGQPPICGRTTPSSASRADYVGGPPWTLFRTVAAASRHRLVWPDLARRLTACALTGRRDAAFVPLNTCYVASARSAEEAERLAAWLNSTWIRAVARLGAVPASGGFHRFTAAVVEPPPAAGGGPRGPAPA